MMPKDRKAAAGLLEENMAEHAPLDDDEPTEAEIRASIRRSMQQALSGETRPADEALEEIRRELAAYADARQDH